VRRNQSTSIGAELATGSRPALRRTHHGVPLVRSNHELAVHLQRSVGRLGTDTDDGAVGFLDDARHLSAHQQFEVGEVASLASEEVEKVPLRHEGHVPERLRQLSKVGERNRPLRHLHRHLSHLRVRQPQELVTKAELVHDPERRRVYRVAAEVSEEVGVFLKHYTVTPWRASSRPTITPAGPPPTMQQVVPLVLTSDRPHSEC
jgi:hypothetical protein